MSELQAVLWDMDGTLVDTEPYWMDAEFDLIGGLGGTWTTEHGLALVGNDLLVSGRYIKSVTGIELSPEEIVEELLDRVIERVNEAVPWRPGALALLDEITAAGIPCGLVTMSYRRFVDPVLAALPPDTFTAVVTGDEVTRGKPHPDPYLAAAAAVGLSASQTLAIEDSATGVASAVAAGCRVVVVPLHVPIAPAPGLTLVPDLESLSLADLRKVMALGASASVTS